MSMKSSKDADFRLFLFIT